MGDGEDNGHILDAIGADDDLNDDQELFHNDLEDVLQEKQNSFDPDDTNNNKQQSQGSKTPVKRGTCPSVLKGEPCWALSKGKKCYYENHDPGQEYTRQKNVYVAHLPPEMNQEAVEQLFSQYGEITETKMLVDPRTQLARGVAFVHFSKHEDALKAIAGVDGVTLPGQPRALSCKFAHANERVARRSRGGGRGGPPRRDERERGPPPMRRGQDRPHDYYREREYDHDYDYDYDFPPSRGDYGYGPRMGRRPPPPRYDPYYDRPYDSRLYERPYSSDPYYDDRRDMYPPYPPSHSRYVDDYYPPPPRSAPPIPPRGYAPRPDYVPPRPDYVSPRPDYVSPRPDYV